MRMAFLIFVWRQWPCDGDNGRYVDCFVYLMGPQNLDWVWSFSWIVRTTASFTITNFSSISAKSYPTIHIWENETHLSPFFLIIVIFWFLLCALFNFDLVKLLYMGLRDFLFFSFLYFFFFFKILSKASHLQYPQSISLLIKIKISLWSSVVFWMSSLQSIFIVDLWSV